MLGSKHFYLVPIEPKVNKENEPKVFSLFLKTKIVLKLYPTRHLSSFLEAIIVNYFSNMGDFRSFDSK